ncbi:MAG: 50S ribosomal protein L22 [Deltaproteobacteria bacterium]|jgi:large subunit ribosomal protein L22|nr:50S ribosomal protein L22 [Deltaproteobacteria bacterium]
MESSHNRKETSKQEKIRLRNQGAARAVGRYFRVAPDKTRIMARAVVGRGVEAAQDLLRFSPNKSAFLILKVLESAVANADHNFSMDVDELKVQSIFVDRGPMLKRYHPCAHGRAKPILKRTSHITVIVGKAPNKGR